MKLVYRSLSSLVPNAKDLFGLEIDQLGVILLAHLSVANCAFSSERWRLRTLWGAPRIHGELRILGVDISERTVSRLLKRHPRPSSQTWRTFLANHIALAASMDFFTVPTL